MAINKKLIHFKNKENFNTEVANGNILDTSIVFIKDSQEIYTHGKYYTCKDWANDINNLQTQINILVGSNASTAIENFNEIISFLEGIEDTESLDSIIALIQQQIAEASVDEVIVSATEPTDADIWVDTTSDGDIIPVEDAPEDGKLYGRQNKEWIELDLSSYATKIEMDGKQNLSLKFENLEASQWVSDSTYEDYPYRCDVTCSGVTANNYAEVVFALSQATSRKYAPLCETKANAVSIWSSENTSITIPTILVTI